MEMWEYIKNNLERNEKSIIKEYSSQKTYTYSNLLNEIERIGKTEPMQSLKGAKCAILCKENIETMKGVFLCWYVGMVAIPISLNYGEEHCRSIIEVTKPDVIISDDLELCKNFDVVIFIVDGTIYKYADEHINAEEELKNVDIMMCTSGTTGKPKAIMFSGRELQKNVELILSYFTVQSDDTMLICRPIYHCAVLVGELLLSLQVGADIIFYSGGFQPFIIADVLNEYDITVMCGTPTLFKSLVNCMKHRKIRGNLKIIALSGEYLLTEYAYDIRESFPESKIYNVYGLTEAGPRVSFLPYNMFDDIPQSVGYSLPEVEIKIVDKVNEEVKVGELGEVWVKTPSIMLGYYNNVKKTSSQFCDGWFKTGDIGSIDENGHLYIWGRSDDMIIKAGMNIYPQEIEKRIVKLDEVKEVLVYGKLVRNVEQIIADIVLQEEYSHETSWNIMKKVSEVLPQYMMITNIRIVESLPRNASGKLVRPTAQVRNL